MSETWRQIENKQEFTIYSLSNLFFATKADEQFIRARNMSTGHKGSFKTALTSTLRIRIKNNITK